MITNNKRHTNNKKTLPIRLVCKWLFGFLLIHSSLSAYNTSSQQKETNYFIDNSLPVIKPESHYNVFDLITHGRAGELFINGGWKDAKAIAAFLENKLKTLPAITHVNIYGCEFAKGAKGMAAVKYLEKKLRLSIAASTNITGKGGDWILEYGEPKNAMNLGYSISLQTPCNSLPIVGTNPSSLDSPAVTNNVLSNICNKTTADLTTLELPAVAGYQYAWRKENASSGSNTVFGTTAITTPTAVTAGTYYAFARQVPDNCYSLTGSKVVVTINTCNSCTDPTKQAVTCDFDGDGINNNWDIDRDNDGVLNFYESCSNGLSASTPLTSIKMAKNVPWPGIYFFNVDGQTFSTFVDEKGWVMIVNDFGNGSGNLPETSSLTTTSRGILSKTILAALTEIAEVRISSNDVTNDGVGLNILSRNATIRNRVKTFVTLDQGQPDETINASWSGANSPRITSTATSCTTGAGTDLNKNIAHACGNGSGIHWIPALGYQLINWGEGTIDNDKHMRLWIYHPGSVSLQFCDTDNDGITNQFDLDSDGDGCPDLVEAGVKTATGVTTDAGHLINGTPNTDTLRGFAIINGTYGNNGFANSIETGGDVDTAHSTVSNTNYNTKALISSDVSLCIPLKPNGLIAGGTICVTSPGKLTFTANTTNPGTGPYTLVIKNLTTNISQTYTNITSGTPFNIVPTGPTATTQYSLIKIIDTNNYITP